MQSAYFKKHSLSVNTYRNHVSISPPVPLFQKFCCLQHILESVGHTPYIDANFYVAKIRRLTLFGFTLAQSPYWLFDTIQMLLHILLFNSFVERCLVN